MEQQTGNCCAENAHRKQNVLERNSRFGRDSAVKPGKNDGRTGTVVFVLAARGENGGSAGQADGVRAAAAAEAACESALGSGVPVPRGSTAAWSVASGKYGTAVFLVYSPAEKFSEKWFGKFAADVLDPALSEFPYFAAQSSDGTSDTMYLFTGKITDTQHLFL